MSTKPTTVATWDSGNVNTSAITGGHATNGFGSTEVPTSAEVNTVFALAGQWQSFLNDVFTVGGVAVGNLNLAGNVAITGLYKHSSRTIALAIQVPTTGITSVDVSLTNQFLVVPIVLDVGKRILAVRAFIKDSVTGPTKLQVNFVTAPATGSAFAVLGGSAASAGSGINQTISASGLTQAVQAGYVYMAQIVYNTGTATTHVYGIEVDYDQP